MKQARTLWILAVAALAMTPWSAVRAAPPPPPQLIVDPLATGPASLIQSSFGTESGQPGNFEVVVLQGNDLVHYWHGNSDPAFAWQRGLVVTTAATGPGCIIQSDFGAEGGRPGNLEVVVQEGDHVTHYFHDSAAPNTPWVRGLSFGHRVTGGPSLIQSDFKSGAHGNFEVVVPEGPNLVHYWHDNSDVRSAWQRGLTVTTTATGGGTLIQSDFKNGGHGNFEVLVEEAGHVAHYWHDNGDVRGPWQPGGTFAAGVTGAPALIQGSFGGGRDRHGNFEAAVRQGTRLVHWFKDNAAVTNPWVPARDIVTDGPANSAASLIQSTFGVKAGHPGNFEVVVLRDRAAPPPASRQRGDEASFDLVHYFHANDAPGAPWRRGQTVTYRGRSEKVCQLTGGHDRQTGQPTTSDTAGRFDLGATDLGYPVDDGTTLALYFGDSRTARMAGLPDEWAWDDAVGLSTDRVAPTPIRCLAMTMATKAPGDHAFGRLTVAQRQPTPPERRFYQGLFNVPSSGFTVGPTRYVLFWTNHCAFSVGSACDRPAPDTDTRGTGRLTRQTGAVQFQELYALPPQFNYTAALNADTVPNLPQGQGQGVYVWGIDRYRASYPTLAVVPAASVETPGAWRYLTGVDGGGTPRWSGAASQAVPMFDTGDPSPGCIGEFSVSWVAPLGRWVMLYNCAMPGAGTVRARVANAPWGPWSAPTEVFRPDMDKALCRFMHAAGNAPCIDHLDGDNGASSGDPYAPFILSRFTRAVPGGAEITFLMSTWNPYQVVVMRMTLAADG